VQQSMQSAMQAPMATKSPVMAKALTTGTSSVKMPVAKPVVRAGNCDDWEEF